MQIFPVRLLTYYGKGSYYGKGLAWSYGAQGNGYISYLYSAAKPTKKQMRQVRKALRKATK